MSAPPESGRGSSRLEAEAERIWAEQRDGSAASAVRGPQQRFERRRFTHGREIRDYLLARYRRLASGARILDLGCGDAGLSLPFALDPRYRVAALETAPRPRAGRVARDLGVPLWPLAADGATLPFADGSFELVLYVETIEHVADARRVGVEVARVLASGGLCYVTTPARLRHLLRRDPHHGIPGLLLLPDGLQRLLFERLRPRSSFGVEHIFWSVRGIARTLRPLSVIEVTSRYSWVRGPLRNLDWDWVVLEKS